MQWPGLLHASLARLVRCSLVKIAKIPLTAVNKTSSGPDDVHSALGSMCWSVDSGNSNDNSCRQASTVYLALTSLRAGKYTAMVGEDGSVLLLNDPNRTAGLDRTTVSGTGLAQEQH